MDEELKAYLTEMKHEMSDMKREMADMKREMNTEMKSGLADIKSDMAEMKSELIQHTETVETRLLGEFWKWARSADLRYRQGTSAVGFLDDRVQAVEDRVSELERRKAG